MPRIFPFLLFALVAPAGCSEESFDARFAREQQAMARQAADIEANVARDMRAAQEAERATAEEPMNGR